MVQQLQSVRAQQKTRATRSASGGSESDVKPEPAIYQDIPPRFHGQHGGELLIHKDIYGGYLSKGRMFRYLPGMICIGTRVRQLRLFPIFALALSVYFFSTYEFEIFHCSFTVILNLGSCIQLC